MLVDSHCHLDFPEFAPDLEAVVARAGEAGVGTMLTIGTRLDRFPGVRAVAPPWAISTATGISISRLGMTDTTALPMASRFSSATGPDSSHSLERRRQARGIRN